MKAGNQTVAGRYWLPSYFFPYYGDPQLFGSSHLALCSAEKKRISHSFETT